MFATEIDSQCNDNSNSNNKWKETKFPCFFLNPNSRYLQLNGTWDFNMAGEVLYLNTLKKHQQNIEFIFLIYIQEHCYMPRKSLHTNLLYR